MKREKRIFRLLALIAGFMLAGALAFFIVQGNESDQSLLLNETQEVAELSKGMQSSPADVATMSKCDGDSKCGEGKCGDGDKKEAKKEAKKEGESKDDKCGEGKCGDGKEEKKADKKDKCGEGKCGE